MSLKSNEGTVISRLELVLQKNVLQTCVSLQCGYGAEFLSTNFERHTTSKIKVTKQFDESARICLTVTRFPEPDFSQPEHILIHRNPKDSDTERDDGNQELVTNMLPILLSGNNFPEKVSDSGRPPSVTEDNTHCIKADMVNADSDPDIPKDQGTGGSYSSRNDNKQMEKDETEEDLRHTEGSPLPPCEIDSLDLSDLTRDYMPDGGVLLEKHTCSHADHSVPSKTNNDPIQRKESETNRRQVEEYTEEKNVLEIKGKEDENTGDEHATTRLSKALIPRKHINEEGAPCKSNRNPDTELFEDTPKRDLLKGINKYTRSKTGMKRPNYKREPNIPCKFCAAKLKDSENLFDHVKLKHGQVDGVQGYLAEIKESLKIRCDVCHKVYSRREQLTVHMNTIHKPTISVNCPDCNLSVKSQRHLQDHIRRIHKNKERIHLCHSCPASFKVHSYLADHLKYVHSTNSHDAFKCDSCEKSYKTEKYLRNHIMRVHGTKKHICKYCKKSFQTLNNLSRHVTLLHEKKGVKPFQCNICQRRFTLKANLKDHMNTLHYNSYSLRCPVCKLGFRRKNDLKTHEIHTHGPSARKVTPGAKRLHSNMDGHITVMPFQTAPQKIVQVGESTQEQEVEGSGIQYILATPEILQAFGLQLAPELSSEKVDGGNEQNETDDSLPGEETMDNQASVASVEGRHYFAVS